MKTIRYAAFLLLAMMLGGCSLHGMFNPGLEMSDRAMRDFCEDNPYDCDPRIYVWKGN